MNDTSLSGNRRIIDDRYAPIDTAPRDGTSIFVAHEDVGSFLMRWEDDAENDFFAPGVTGMWVATDGSMTWAEQDDCGPSHWRAS